MKFTTDFSDHTEFTGKTPAEALQTVSANIASELRAFADAVETAGTDPATFWTIVEAARIKRGLTVDSNYDDRFILHFGQATEAVSAHHDALQAELDAQDERDAAREDAFFACHPAN